MSTTTRPKRPTNLHNFTLPNLKWGSQRHLKCMKIDSRSSSGSGDHRLRRRSPPLKFADSSVSIPAQFNEAGNLSSKNNQHYRLKKEPLKSVESGSEEGIKELRIKIISDLEKITQSMFTKDEQDEEQQINGCDGQEKDMENSPVRPWNLRKRRAACKEPISGNQYNSLNNGFAIDEKIVNPSPSINDLTMLKGRGRAAATAAAAESNERRTKLVVSLSKKEIDEDFMAMIGHRAPRRPKKRSKAVQKNLDDLFPGLYLNEVTLESYKVPEETKNRRR